MDGPTIGAGTAAGSEPDDGLRGLRALDLAGLRPERALALPSTTLAVGWLLMYLAIPVTSSNWVERGGLGPLIFSWVPVMVVDWLLLRPRQGSWTPRSSSWPSVAAGLVSAGALAALWIALGVGIGRTFGPPGFTGDASAYNIAFAVVAGAAGSYYAGALAWPRRWYLAGAATSLLFAALFALFGKWMAVPLVAVGVVVFALGVRRIVRLVRTTPRARAPRAGSEWQPAGASDSGTTSSDAFRDIMASLYLVGTADDVYLARKTGLSWPDLYRHLYWLEGWGYLAANSGYRRGTLRVSGVRLTPWGRGEFAGSLEQAGVAAA
jgi:hypothetical protein